MPFQGVLGYGQGADVAALLPLLHRQHMDNFDGDNNYEGNENTSMFVGLKFVVLIDGQDLLLQSMEDNNKTHDGNFCEEDRVENDVYIDSNGISSLHIIVDGNDHAGWNDLLAHRDSTSSSCWSSRSSERLAQLYGPNATIHNCTSSSSLFNIIGKFLVTQKNKLHHDSKSRQLILLQHQLFNVEQLATIAISEEIQRNPPNALMAVIGPSAMMSVPSSENSSEEINDEEDRNVQEVKDVITVVDKAVGAWQGGRRREFGEEGGGAPCPEEFLLREDQRLDITSPVMLDDGNDNDDDDDEIPMLLNLDNVTSISPTRDADLPPVPVTILTGFLGSGKSTLVRNILTSTTHRKRIAVIENEFGGGDTVSNVRQLGMPMANNLSALSVETMIVKDGMDGSSLADFIELPNGCVCCTVKNSLIETLEALLSKRSDLDYIIIEASGMADPGPVASIFWLDEALNSRIQLDGIVTCVDAKNIAFQLQSTSSAASSCNTSTEGVSGSDGGGDEAARQIAFADRIIVNKVDLLEHVQKYDENGEDIDSVIRQIKSINPTAPIKATTYSSIQDIGWILDTNCFDPNRARDVDVAFQSATTIQNEYNCTISGCSILHHLSNDVCGHCSRTEPLVHHRHTNAVGTIALFGYGSVDLHRVHSWLASILWPNQDENDTILRARLEASPNAQHETRVQSAKDDDATRKSQTIYRAKGVLSVGHALDKFSNVIPSSNDWVDEGVAAGLVTSIDGTDRRRYILQAVHDLWDILPASEILHWEATETRCCKVILIGKYLKRQELQEGFNACFTNNL